VTQTQIKLPILRSPQPPAKPSPLAPGSLVQLRNCPGEPGIVREMRRSKVLVWWPDLHYLGRHRPDELLPASAGVNDSRTRR
jgi:hypothetical protein